MTQTFTPSDRASIAQPGQALVLPTALLGPLLIPGGVDRAAELAALAARTASYATQARGPGTRRAYRAAWRQFCQWCASLGREPLAGNPDTIAMYLVRRADDGRAVSTLRVGLAAIRAAHQLAGIPLDLRQPAFAMVLEGITRSRGRRPKRQATPAVPDLLRKLLATRPGADQPLGARDRAMLLLGFAGALRRAELVALRLADVTVVPGRGFLLTIGRSKTDPQGRGEQVAIAANPADPDFCPETALQAWLVHRHQGADLCADLPAADRDARPLFCAVTKSGRITGTPLSDKAVVRLVKQAAAEAGFDATHFAGHSLRAGLATAAGNAGAGLPALMRQTRHRSTAVALGYLRPAELWTQNVSRLVFAAAGGAEDA
jgi:site-specific recombinase XerD